MNKLSVYAYEDESGELFVYRCPECGSSGPEGSHCGGHEPPLELASALTTKGPKREPVRVPGVGEEPRHTLEQVRAGLVNEGPARDAATAAVAREQENGCGCDQCLGIVAVKAALDHFTQQPAGVGADDQAAVFRVFGQRGGNASLPVSADSDGSQQPQGGEGR